MHYQALCWQLDCRHRVAWFGESHYTGINENRRWVHFHGMLHSIYSFMDHPVISAKTTQDLISHPEHCQSPLMSTFEALGVHSLHCGWLPSDHRPYMACSISTVPTLTDKTCGPLLALSLYPYWPIDDGMMDLYMLGEFGCRKIGLFNNEAYLDWGGCVINTLGGRIGCHSWLGRSASRLKVCAEGTDTMWSPVLTQGLVCFRMS